MKWTGEIKDFIVTGDLHGDINPIKDIFESYDKNFFGLIILGDAGFNFYLNKTDRKFKERVQALSCLVYCVRGNHEERPENLPNMKEAYDEIINGYVYYEELFPNIRYLKDGGIYNFNGYSTLVIGGAYSVDKNYRLERARAAGHDPETHWTGWFKDEQLTAEERNQISKDTKDLMIDFVLTHTCPYMWQPYDLFLSQVKQSEVDKSMEEWLDELRKHITVNKAWLFGHFHDDRIVRPHVEMFYKKSQFLSEIAQRWEDWDNGYQLDWWLKLDPNWFFWQEEQEKRIKKQDLGAEYNTLWG